MVSPHRKNTSRNIWGDKQNSETASKGRKTNLEYYNVMALPSFHMNVKLGFSRTSVFVKFKYRKLNF